MALKEFKIIQAEDKDLNKVQENVRLYVNQLNDRILDGVLLKRIDLNAASTVDIPHKLSRAFQGWQILDQDGSAIIWRDAGSSSDRAKFLPLKTSADVTVDIWVF